MLNKTQITLIIISIALIVSLGYIVTEKITFCETAKNDSYAAGFNQGIEYWNTIVMYNVNNNGKISYWFNNSYYELPIAQLCGGER